MESKHTRSAYRYDITLWVDWCFTRQLNPLNVRKGGYLAFLGDRRELGDAESTRARRASAICSWYHYLLENDFAEVNPAALSRNQRPKVPRGTSMTLALSTAQTQALICVADADSPMVSAFVRLLYDTGARVSEILDANVDDLTMQRGHHVLPVVGKGNRERELIIPESSFERLTNYLATRDSEVERLPALAAGAKPPRPLFVDNQGRRLTRHHATRILKRLAKVGGPELASLVGRLSPHVSRHSFATDLLAAKMPIHEVQKALGHQSADSTARYDHGKLTRAGHPMYVRADQIDTVPA